MRIQLPDRSFTLLIIFRASVVMVALRVASLRVASLFPGGILEINLYASVIVIAVTAALVTLDGRRRNEHMYMANLGVSLPTLLAIAALPPTVMEIALSVVVRSW